MNRRHFRAVVTVAADGELIVDEREKYAWNSAIRASEAIVREYARNTGTVFTGATPEVMGADQSPTGVRLYRRVWTSESGREVTALVWEVVSS